MKYSKLSNKSFTATMKHLLVMAFAILTIGCGEKKSDGVNAHESESVDIESDGVNRKELELREDIWYLRGAEFSYTGKSYLLHKNGLKKRVENYKNGKKDGVQIHWHENGQKRIEANYKNGKWEGPWLSWNENGKKKSEANYKDGKKDGLWLMWHKNGQKMVETNWKDDKILPARKYWNSKGEPVDSEEEAFK